MGKGIEILTEHLHQVLKNGRWVALNDAHQQADVYDAIGRYI